MKEYLYELKEGLIISFRAIASNKARSVLTTLGIIIGVTSVVLMSTAINGIDNAFQKGVSSLGSDNLYIDKWKWFNNDTPWWELRNRRNLTLEDYERFKELAKLPLATAPTVWSYQNVKYKDRVVESIIVQGTNDEYIKTTNLTFSEGRFFNEFESKGGRNVVVLGYEIAKNLFPNGYAVGEFVRVKGHKFKVVGVLDEQGSWVMGNFNPDKQIFMPLQNIYKYFQGENFRSLTINVRARNSMMVEATKEEAIGIMRRIRGLKYNEPDDFSINQQEGILNTINQTVGVIQIAGLFITGLALFVGAVGIMNIMFVSVKERTKEIGIRKAIGAKRRTILSQFITESAIICLIGGFLGLIIALILSLVVNQFLPTSVQVDTIILAIVISIATGVISGFAPAYTAAKLDPVEALRYE
ncbi:ABC transporter efflux protein [Melioribacter roseus P3M-2]|uniref:ABC transporter efflux protein n=1 Tax=Melioribacter roseus (strain DSM 23840 / JCM 17771 / VKM B-2668 / P3M-2) TaxID=1191523 RepID=I7A2U1_MELRP|nr:ABC transporter permease [Melioribacter roseus]AFN75513.1 ABC transporter efflux protein [Melioribacter roseus P3M-2]